MKILRKMMSAILIAAMTISTIMGAAAPTLAASDENVVYIETDFGNSSGVWSKASGTRNAAYNLNKATLPDISKVSVSLAAGALGSDGGSQSTFVLKNSQGTVVVGLQFMVGTSGLATTVFTGWTGTANMNQYSDRGKYTNSASLGELTAGEEYVYDFVIDKTNHYITVTVDNTTVSLAVPSNVSLDDIASMAAGMYRYYAAITVSEIKVTEPNSAFMSLSGDNQFAKIAGKTVTRAYDKTETVITPGENFAWTLSRTDGLSLSGITVTDGVVSVTDTAVPGTVTLTATGSTGKSASFDIKIEDFANVVPTVDGPVSYEVGQTGTYTVTKLVDEYGDDVIDIFKPVFSSDDESVVAIDATTGVAEAKAAGTTNITVTIGNTGKEAKVKIPVTVASYYVVADATGNSTKVSVENIKKIGIETGYLVTTATADGVKVDSYEVALSSVKNNAITVDTTGAAKVEIAPVYSAALNTKYAVPNAAYNVTATLSGRRTDVYVNDQLIINNLNQGSDSWTVGRVVPSSGSTKFAGDVVIGQGYANFNLRDNQGATFRSIVFSKAPSIVNRAKRIYVIGDSLVADYYGEAPAGQEGLVRTGWGQVLENYVADGVEVTNLGNSGAWATGMLNDAFTNVVHSAKPGDIVVWESGYNDRNHGGADPMIEAITTAINTCKAMGVEIYLVTPNASRHDYTESVVLSGSIRTLAQNTDTPLIDLSKRSFEILSGYYGTNASAANDVLLAYYNNSGDTLHSSYNAANLWAAVVAQGLYDSGKREYVNTTYSYTFNDGTRDVTAKVEGNVLLGDVSGDGVINPNDAVLVLRDSAKLIELTDEQIEAADVNTDGEVNPNDAVLILRYSAKLIDSFD